MPKYLIDALDFYTLYFWEYDQKPRLDRQLLYLPNVIQRTIF